MPKRWFIDFDDTLAIGPITWSVEYVLPKFIEENQLICDLQQLSDAVLVAQSKENQGINHDLILRELFDVMRWPSALQRILYSEVMTNFQPRLFDDAIPFLDYLQEHNQILYVISNNPRSPKIAEKLGIRSYFKGFFIPDQANGIHPKPHRSLWDYVLSLEGEITMDEACMIGDDPWSDGQFAENCGLKCWIVDRGLRYRSLLNEKSYLWVQSLLEIEIM